MTTRLQVLVVTMVSGAGLLLGASGCRKPDKLAPVDLGAAVEDFDFAAAEGYAPQWNAPSVVELDDGLLVHWLEEPGTPALNVRLVLPMPDRPDPTQVAVAAASLDAELQRAFAGASIAVRIHHAPDRLEIVVHALDDEAELVFDTLREVISAKRPEGQLRAAQQRSAATLAASGAGRQGLTALTDHLLDRHADAPPADPRSVEAADMNDLVRTRAELLDPRRAVLVVHTGRPLGDYERHLASLGNDWRSTRPLTGLLKAGKNVAVDRLRKAVPDERPNTFLTSEPRAKLQRVPDSSGRATGYPVIIIGRLIPTPTAQDRAMARLAHRVVQEELDARLVISGPVALFVVRVNLKRREPGQRIREALEDLEQLAITEHRRDRLDQAAHLWLGARLVSASLRGEDWTALWSEAFDLSERDAEIPLALAREAKLMLQADGDALAQWQRRWLRPGGGEPGWHWTLAGADDEDFAAVQSALGLAE